MADTTWTTMHIGGALPASKIEAFLEAIESEFYYEMAEAPSSEEDLRKIITKGESVLLQAQVKGVPDDVIAFCKANNLTYWQHSDYGFEWDSYIEIWSPGMDKPEETPASAQGYSPLVSHGTLGMWMQKGATLQQVLDDVARFESTKVPPFTIVEVADVPAGEPIGAITPDGTRLNHWEERLRTAGCTPVYKETSSCR